LTVTKRGEEERRRVGREEERRKEKGEERGQTSYGVDKNEKAVVCAFLIIVVL
jgi:hypothetical protein